MHSHSKDNDKNYDYKCKPFFFANEERSESTSFAPVIEKLRKFPKNQKNKSAIIVGESYLMDIISILSNKNVTDVLAIDTSTKVLKHIDNIQQFFIQNNNLPCKSAWKEFQHRFVSKKYLPNALEQKLFNTRMKDIGIAFSSEKHFKKTCKAFQSIKIHRKKVNLFSTKECQNLITYLRHINFPPAIFANFTNVGDYYNDFVRTSKKDNTKETIFDTLKNFSFSTNAIITSTVLRRRANQSRGRIITNNITEIHKLYNRSAYIQPNPAPTLGRLTRNHSQIQSNITPKLQMGRTRAFHLRRAHNETRYFSAYKAV